MYNNNIFLVAISFKPDFLSLEFKIITFDKGLMNNYILGDARG